MGTATTQIAVESSAHIRIRRGRVTVEQCLRHDDHAAAAIAALCGLLVNESLLQSARPAIFTQPFQRGDRPADGRLCQRLAGRDGFTVDQN